MCIVDFFYSWRGAKVGEEDKDAQFGAGSLIMNHLVVMEQKDLWRGERWLFRLRIVLKLI